MFCDTNKPLNIRSKFSDFICNDFKIINFSDVNYQFNRGLSKLETEVNATLNINNSYSGLGLSAIYKNKEKILEYGARPLKRAIQNNIEDLITDKILSGEIKDNMKIKIDIENEEIIVKV